MSTHTFSHRLVSRLRFGAAGAALAALAVAGAAAPVQAQMQERTLRVAVNAIPPDMGNPYKAIGSPASYTFSAIFDSLTFVDQTGLPQPALALSWENVDATTWRFRLRPDIVFANGEKLDADAVVATVNWLLSEEGKVLGNRAAFELSNMVGARAIDSMTVEITTSSPAPIFASQQDVMAIVPPKAWADQGVAEFVRRPQGTGPYKAEVDWTPAKVALVANETSWRKPRIRNLEVFQMNERPARLSAFLSGQVDVMIGISPDNIADVEAAGGRVDRAVAPQNLSWALLIDTEDPVFDITPLKDKRVRQAMNYAVDMDSIVDGLLSNVGANGANGLIPPVAFGYNADLKPYPFDPDKAKTLLAAAGYADGFDLKVEFVCGGFPADCDIHQQVAQDLGKVGINVELNRLVFPNYIGKLLGRNKWEGNAFVSVNDVLPTLDAMNGYKKSTCQWMVPFYCNQAHSGLIEQINTELDVDKRRRLLQEFAAIYHEEATHVFLTEIIDLTGVSTKLKGFKNIVRNFNYEDMSFVE